MLVLIQGNVVGASESWEKDEIEAFRLSKVTYSEPTWEKLWFLIKVKICKISLLKIIYGGWHWIKY